MVWFFVWGGIWEVVVGFFRRLFDDSGSVLGRRFAIVLQVMVLLSLVSSALGTLPSLDGSARSVLSGVELAVLVFFSVEYCLRVLVAERRLRYVFSFYGVVDLLAVLPFYLALGLDLSEVRALRIFRLLRLFKLLRYQSALLRFKRAMIIAKEELILFGLVSAVMLYVAAVGIYFFERAAQPELFASVLHCLWWALTTLTTVGYGDMFPVTAGGKVFTFFVLIIGLGVVAVPTGLVSSALSQVRREDSEG